MVHPVGGAVVLDDGADFAAEIGDPPLDLLVGRGRDRHGVCGNVLRQVVLGGDGQASQLELLHLQLQHELVANIVSSGDGLVYGLPAASDLVDQPEIAHQFHRGLGLSGGDFWQNSFRQGRPIVCVVFDGEHGSDCPGPPMPVVQVLLGLQDGARGLVQCDQLIKRLLAFRDSAGLIVLDQCAEIPGLGLGKFEER